MLENEANQKEKLKEEIAVLKSQLLQMSFEADETRRSLDRGGSGKVFTGLDSFVSQVKYSQLSDSGNGQKASIAKLFEQEANQEKIVEAGGLTSLMMLLRSSEDETIRRVAASAIANLALNGNSE